MQRDEVKAMLKAWGHATANRYAYTRIERSNHQLARVAHDKPLPKADAARALIERSGYTRRLRMAQSVQIAGVRYVPLWACDPTPARNDADRPHDNAEIAVDQGIPDDLRWIDDAIRRIGMANPMRGRVVRTEYTISASQSVKARMAGEGYDGKFTKDMYRAELDKAIDIILWEISRAA